MSSPTRWVIVDDTSPDIVYDGHSWIVDAGSLDSLGDVGPPYRNTLHGTNVSSSFSYNFSGTAIRAWGTNAIRNGSKPPWECFVDNVSIGSAPAGLYAESNALICPETKLQDQAHTLTVTATVTTNQTVWFDRIDYVPSSSLSLEDKAILVNHSDPNLQYDAGWVMYGDFFAHGTSKHGAIFAFDFYGVSVTWYGYALGGNSSFATWQIDGQLPETVIIEDYTNKSEVGHVEKVFETTLFPNSQHRLLVTYNGSDQTIPLNLVYLIVQNGTESTRCTSLALSGSTLTTSSDTCAMPTSSNKADSSSGHGAMSNSTKSGVVIGSVIGGAVVLVVVIFLICLFRRRRNLKELFNLHPFENVSTFRSQGATFRPLNHHQEKPSIRQQLAVQGPTTDIDGAHQPNILTNARLPPEGRAIETNTNGITRVQVSNQDHDQSDRHLAFDRRYPFVGPREPLRFVIHQDSGVRLYEQLRPNQIVVELPPWYTPG